MTLQNSVFRKFIQRRVDYTFLQTFTANSRKTFRYTAVLLSNDASHVSLNPKYHIWAFYVHS